MKIKIVGSTKSKWYDHLLGCEFNVVGTEQDRYIVNVGGIIDTYCVDKWDAEIISNVETHRPYTAVELLDVMFTQRFRSKLTTNKCIAIEEVCVNRRARVTIRLSESPITFTPEYFMENFVQENGEPAGVRKCLR